MKELIRCLYIILAFSGISLCLKGQSRQELEKQRMQIIKEIENTSKALESTRKSREKNQSQLKALEQQMASRKKLLATLEAEIQMNDEIIRQNETSLTELQEKYSLLKNQYSMMVRNGYMKKISQSRWTFLLSSESLNELMMRWRYMSQFEQFATQKLEQMTMVRREILVRNEAITQSQQEKLSALEESAKNMEKLQLEQREKDALVQKLKKEEDKLRTSLKKREKERENLNRAIEKIIIAEVTKAEKNKPAEGASNAVSAAESGSFEKMKGRLPIPVSGGKISSRFGTHPHPTVPTVQISNSGVDFSLSGQQDVSCVFDGEVVGLIFMPGFKNVVIVKHGTYSTVYAKLDEVMVKKGQTIQKGKVIGKAGLTEDGKNEMHFELWKDKTKLDPQKWFGK